MLTNIFIAMVIDSFNLANAEQAAKTSMVQQVGWWADGQPAVPACRWVLLHLEVRGACVSFRDDVVV